MLPLGSAIFATFATFALVFFSPLTITTTFGKEPVKMISHTQKPQKKNPRNFHVSRVCAMVGLNGLEPSTSTMSTKLEKLTKQQDRKII